jgi:uncharacterized RDD family membrane protein YckC
VYTAPRHRDLQTARLAVLDGTVLGEGVVVDARAASFAVRMLSGLIDAFAIYTVATLLIFAAAAVGTSASERAATVALLVTVVFVLVVLPVGVETLTRGYSLGKYALGIRIVRDDGGPIRFRQALVRGLLGVLELWMTAGGLAVVVTFFNSRGKRLGDIMAGTYALRTRSGGVRLTPLVMPPHLAGCTSPAPPAWTRPRGRASGRTSRPGWSPSWPPVPRSARRRTCSSRRCSWSGASGTTPPPSVPPSMPRPAPPRSVACPGACATSPDRAGVAALPGPAAG